MVLQCFSPTPFARDDEAKAAVGRARTFQLEASTLRRKARSSSNGNGSRAGSCACGSRNACCCPVGGDAHAAEGGSRGHHHLEQDVSRLEKQLEEERGAFAAARAENVKLQAIVEVWIRGGGGVVGVNVAMVGR